MALAEKTGSEGLPEFRLGLKDHFYTGFQILTGILVAVDLRMATGVLLFRSAKRVVRTFSRRARENLHLR